MVRHMVISSIQNNLVWGLFETRQLVMVGLDCTGLETVKDVFHLILELCVRMPIGRIVLSCLSCLWDFPVNLSGLYCRAAVHVLCHVLNCAVRGVDA